MAGELDASDAGGLRTDLSALDRMPGVLVLDLGRRTFVATSGVAGREAHLLLAGELDVATRPVLEAALLASLRAEPASLVLDLRDLTFIDGRGAAVLAATARRMAAWGGALEVGAARPSIRRVFALCGFHDLVTGGVPAGALP